MRTPETLAEAFGPKSDFEKFLTDFAVSENLIPDATSLGSKRFLSRSVAPHISRLSSLFNREGDDTDQGAHLTNYWSDSSNKDNLRLAYFLSFMPPNLFRTAAIWAELARLGFKWTADGPLRGIEFGAGPASASCGIAVAEAECSVGLPPEGSWALLEQDRAMMNLGARWAQAFFERNGRPGWTTREFQRKIDLKLGFLPKTAPTFNLWVMSFFLNELNISPNALAEQLLRSWQKHIAENGVIILVESALKAQSRKLLELRKALLPLMKDFQVLLPCLGHQACGALARPEDWCHEEVTWWRPPYMKTLDAMVGLDRKTLPFSYLVLVRSSRDRTEILPGLRGKTRHRLVSPAHSEGRDLEFFLCGQEGKRRSRLRCGAGNSIDEETGLSRGDILLDAELQGDENATRVKTVRAVAK